MGVVELKSDKEFEDAIKEKGTYCIIMFTAGWCGPCKKIYPVVNELSDTKPILYYKLDVDSLPDCTSNNGVTVMPTFQVWYEGQPVYVTEGANEENLRSLHAKVCERIEQKK